MKVKLLRDCSIVALTGSIVEVSEAQYKALGDFCVLADEDKPKVIKAEPKAEPKATKVSAKVEPKKATKATSKK